MNREQMIAWLCIEGWSLYMRREGKIQSLIRGVSRIHENGVLIPESAWVTQIVVVKGVTPIPWEDVDDGQLEIFYEAARLL